MIILILPQEKLLNFGHGNLRKVMEKVMESHWILKVSKSMNPVRLAEPLAWDWLNTNEQREMVMPTITVLYILNWLTNHSTDWYSAQCLTYSMNYFQRLTQLETQYTN